MSKCFVCEKNIPSDHPCLYNHDRKVSICMRCEGAEIEVFKLSILGDGNYLVERDHNGIKEMIKEMEIGESYLVEKISMGVSDFLSLPEFEGF